MVLVYRKIAGVSKIYPLVYPQDSTDALLIAFVYKTLPSPQLSACRVVVAKMPYSYFMMLRSSVYTVVALLGNRFVHKVITIQRHKSKQ